MPCKQYLPALLTVVTPPPVMARRRTARSTTRGGDGMVIRTSHSRITLQPTSGGRSAMSKRRGLSTPLVGYGPGAAILTDTDSSRTVRPTPASLLTSSCTNCSSDLFQQGGSWIISARSSGASDRNTWSRSRISRTNCALPRPVLAANHSMTSRRSECAKRDVGLEHRGQPIRSSVIVAERRRTIQTRPGVMAAMRRNIKNTYGKSGAPGSEM